MDEIESCIEIAIDDLESSKLLLEAGKYRNSVTLSYYAMFSIARALLLKKGLTPKTHDGVITLIGEKYVLDDSAYFGGILIRQLISEDGCEVLNGPWACAEFGSSCFHIVDNFGILCYNI